MFISSKQQAPDVYGPNVDASYGTHTDAGNDDEHTPMSLYSLYGDISGDSVQIFTEAPPGVSNLAVRTDRRISLAILTSILLSRELGMSGL